MNRALRRHPVSTKAAKGGRAAVRPLPRVGAARGAARPAAVGRPGRFAAVAGWRPRYLMDIISELRKVVWPTRQDTLHLTIVVVVVSILMGAVLGALDVGFGWLIDRALLSRNLFDYLFG